MSTIRQLFRLWRMYAGSTCCGSCAASASSCSTLPPTPWSISRPSRRCCCWPSVSMASVPGRSGRSCSCLATAMLATSLSDMFFGYNVRFISRRLGRGQFDHTLIQPQPVWMALLTEGFNPFRLVEQPARRVLPSLSGSAGRVALPLSPAWPLLFVLEPALIRGHRAGLSTLSGAAWPSGRPAPPRRSIPRSRGGCWTS